MNIKNLKEGVELAKEFEIKSVPTVVFLKNGKVENRAYDIEGIKKIIGYFN